MNVCLVSREYPPFFGGGIGSYTVQFSRQLAAAGHDVVVVTVSDDGRVVRQRDGAVTVVRLPFIEGNDWSRPHPAIDTPEHRAAQRAFHPVSIFAMQVAQHLPSLHDEFAFDVVEAPDTGALAWFALNARRTGGMWAAGGPALVTCLHSPTVWIAQYNRSTLSHRERALAMLERESIRWSDGLVCPSDALARWTEEHCGVSPGEIDVIPHCLGDLESIAAQHGSGDAAASREAGSTGRRILFASRLEPRKGVDTLLTGLALAVEQGADLYLDLVGAETPDPQGRGPFGRVSLESSVPEPLRSRVVFHGKLPPPEVARMQSEASAVAVPSPMDNFPMTCMEAMAHGRVVIAARAGGMAQMIVDGESGLLFEPGDARSCAQALRQAAEMSPEAAVAMGRSAAKRIIEVCGNERTIPLRIGNYERAIERRQEALLVRAQRGRQQTRLHEAPGTSRQGAERLMAAVEQGDCHFALGWTRANDGMIYAAGTPTPEHPCAAPHQPRTIALSETAAAHPEVAGVLAGTAPAVQVVERLCRAGFAGSVVPEVLSEVEVPQAPRNTGSQGQNGTRRPLRRRLAGVIGGTRAFLRGLLGSSATEHRIRPPDGIPSRGE